MTTIYFAGSEDSAFAATVNYATTGNGNIVRSSFARAGMVNNSYSSNAYPLSQYLGTPLFGPVSSFWIHGQFGNGNNNGTANGVTMLAVLDNAGVGRILINGTGTAGQVKICSRNAAGTVTTLVTSTAGAVPVTSSAPVAFDLFINYNSSGQCQLWINGINVADTGTGINVTTDSATALAQVQYSTMNSAASSGWSECLIQDTSTLGLAVWTLPPVAAGTTQSWTPNTVGNINPTTFNDTNFVAATAVNSLSEWTVSTTMPSGTWNIEAVVQTARVSVGTSGPLHFEWLVRTSDGSDHVTGSVAPTTSFANYAYVWMTNPHTSAAWASGELIQAGIESLT